jgi:uncharacterized protein with HEPN domain
LLCTQHNRILKYLLEIEQVISEIEELSNRFKGDFTYFQKDWASRRAIEQDIQIIGEAVNKLLQIEPDVKIASAKNIIGLRNLIVHAYDAVDDEMILAIIQKDIPVLKKEVEILKKK